VSGVSLNSAAQAILERPVRFLSNSLLGEGEAPVHQELKKTGIQVAENGDKASSSWSAGCNPCFF
jgi:hypothetical protein